MKRAISVLATVATLFAANSAAATEHTILILPDAYFPQVTYLDEGDTVRFVNASGGSHSVIAEDESWEIGPIASEGEATLVIEGGVEKMFYNKASQAEDGTYAVEGQVSFSDAPLN